MAQGADASEKFLSLVAVLPGALQSFWPSLHPLDLLVGLCCGAGLRLAVYLKSKNAKKYRHGMEYGSARWGTHEDIAPYIDPVFQNNVILSKTESLTMNSRPKDPKTARNKNVLVIGGSGSGKTRFWLKPNLMQMHSSYVVTDPKGTILVECGKMLQRNSFPCLLSCLGRCKASGPACTRWICWWGCAAVLACVWRCISKVKTPRSTVMAWSMVLPVGVHNFKCK